MKFYPVIRVLNAVFVFFVFSMFVSTEISAQKKKATTAKNKTTVTANSSKSKTAAAKNTKGGKNSNIAKTASARTTNSKESKKELAARKAVEARILAERRRAEEARRQTILEEKRRRETAIRAAAARRAAFERGLRTDTVEKILIDDTTGEDLQIRRAAIDALGSRAGTVVVMEAQTGKIVTIVNQDWAIRNSFKPCSTIKLVTATGGKNEELIDSDGNLTKQNASRNLDDALAYSDNTYFQRVGMNLGNEKMISYARALGLGEKTGINADGETPGKLPYGNNNLRIYSHGDDFEVTPLQLAVAVTAIANGGKLVVPQIQKNRNEKTNFNGFYKREVNVPKQNIQRLIPGMLGAAQYGTARRAGIADLDAAGKTGSCIFSGSWIGLFASVAPVENPQYAVVVITRGQSERGKYAAQVAGKIYEALRPRFSGKRNNVLLAQFKPNHKIGVKDKENLKDDEENDADEQKSLDTNVTVENPKKGVTRESASAEEVFSDVSQTNEKTIETKNVTNNSTVPKFNPVVIEYKKDKQTNESGRQPELTRPRVIINP